MPEDQIPWNMLDEQSHGSIEELDDQGFCRTVWATMLSPFEESKIGEQHRKTDTSGG